MRFPERARRLPKTFPFSEAFGSSPSFRSRVSRYSLSSLVHPRRAPQPIITSIRCTSVCTKHNKYSSSRGCCHYTTDPRYKVVSPTPIFFPSCQEEDEAEAGVVAERRLPKRDCSCKSRRPKPVSTNDRPWTWRVPRIIPTCSGILRDES